MYVCVVKEMHSLEKFETLKKSVLLWKTKIRFFFIREISKKKFVAYVEFCGAL